MPPLYIPQSPHIQTLDKLTASPQIRLGLQGMPGNGKTWAALTFPNPIVLNFDRGLGAHIGRSDVVEVPFYLPEFVDTIYPRSGMKSPSNRRDALLKWLVTDGIKLTEEQTLIVDGSTGIQNAFETEYNLHPVTTKQGAIDDFALWRLKVEYFGEVCETFKFLKCHVVYICHETPDRDKKGELNGLVRPLLSGQFGDQLASHFTDFFRQLAHAAPTKENELKAKEFYRIDDATLKEWRAKMPPQTFYVWQTQADEIAKCKTSSLVNAPKYILADYTSFAQYRRKIS